MLTTFQELEAVSRANTMATNFAVEHHPMQEAFLNHYAALVEKLTGTPAAETIATIKAEAQLNEAKYKEELTKILVAAVQDTYVAK
jgi:hypothetical protein